MPTTISVIGPNAAGCPADLYAFGLELGRALAAERHVIVCGGKEGFMEAVCKGARQAHGYRFGQTVGILPGTDRSEANPWCDIVIPTGMGLARNVLVVQSGEVVIAAGGSSGTLSEIALAWQMGKPLIAFTGLGGWSEKLAGTALDGRRPDYILPASSLEEIMNQLKNLTSPQERISPASPLFS